MLFALFSAGCQSVCPLPTSKLGPSGADSKVGGFMYVLGPSNKLFCEVGSFSCQSNPHIFTVRGFEALFPYAGTLGYVVCLTPQLFLPVYQHSNVRPPALLATALPFILSAVVACFCPSYECFFFNSLVVGLPYSLIFWQFWLFFVFKFVVVLLLVV